ncbi:UNVERIFIED_CONTAM: hypothetical protein RMT77_010271 [Armadillidium vulgare]
MNECENSSTTIRNIFLYKLKEPLILKKYLLRNLKHRKWQCLKWDKHKWTEVLGSEQIKISFGKKLSPSEPLDEPQWEHLTFKKAMSFSEMLKWEQGETNFVTDCNTCVSHSEYWAYLDYHYMNNLSDEKLMDENISWDLLGFPEIKAKDSTLWIGTCGANTPCHIDTYGANIVCQISGRKRWILFPKSQTPYLYPTRVPYEESSIYSAAGFPYPNLDKFSNLYQTTPYIVNLEAGDVLFVPKHWWHFVENLEFSVTINSWIPLPDDHHDRLKESVVTYQIGSLCQSLSNISLLKSIFATNAIDIGVMDSTELLDSFLINIKNYIREVECEKETDNESQGLKETDNSYDSLFTKVCKYSFSNYLSMTNIHSTSGKSEKQSSSRSENFVKILIKCFTDERVVNQVKMVVDENMEALKEFN